VYKVSSLLVRYTLMLCRTEVVELSIQLTSWKSVATVGMCTVMCVMKHPEFIQYVSFMVFQDTLLPFSVYLIDTYRVFCEVQISL